MNLTSWFLVIISIALYGFGGYIYLQYLLFIWRTMAPKLTNGKLSLQEILSMAAGIAVLGMMLVFGPLYIAKGIQQGWNYFMPVMVEISNGIVSDVQGMLDGTGPVIKVQDNSGVNVTVQAPVLSGPSGNINPLNGQPMNDPNIDPLTGQAYNDPNAGGGGGGIVPTPIMPEMRQPTLVPTPTLAPTATPFDPNTWTPSDPVPTPQG